jgi:hypothetical protein
MARVKRSLACVRACVRAWMVQGRLVTCAGTAGSHPGLACPACLPACLPACRRPRRACTPCRGACATPTYFWIGGPPHTCTRDATPTSASGRLLAAGPGPPTPPAARRRPPASQVARRRGHAQEQERHGAQARGNRQDEQQVARVQRRAPPPLAARPPRAGLRISVCAVPAGERRGARGREVRRGMGRGAGECGPWQVRQVRQVRQRRRGGAGEAGGRRGRARSLHGDGQGGREEGGQQALQRQLQRVYPARVLARVVRPGPRAARAVGRCHLVRAGLAALREQAGRAEESARAAPAAAAEAGHARPARPGRAA